jgi:fatty-acyl-CoA synthase
MTQPSYVVGDTSSPLIDATIGRYFDAVCADHGDRLAIIARHQSVRWTYSELKERVDALANGFITLGLSPGERVGVWAPNCWTWKSPVRRERKNS